jgi:hypothetical protein
LDPGFTQARHLADPAALEQAGHHTAFFTLGENIGRVGCTIPPDGLPWQVTRHPVALDAWPSSPGRRDGSFTTVMQWESYPAREYGGVRFGLKSESFKPFFDLPRRTSATLELALGGPGAPRELLARNGWHLVNPLVAVPDPWSYRRYIQNSKAEFGIAKHGYVITRGGWFSERSAAYLASGRPVLAQETGFSEWLPRGAGVMAFEGPDEALAGVEEITRRYRHHCRAARAIAEEYFSPRAVLPDLIERAMSAGFAPSNARVGTV